MLKSKILSLSALALVLVFSLSSCLNFETKEYKFTLTGKNSGKLTLKFNNIFSDYDDDELSPSEQADDEFDELINDYLNGTSLEEDFPDAKLVSKRLFEEKGKLCGEAVFEFSSLDQVLLFQYDSKAPFMYYFSEFNETYVSSNGTMGPDYFSAIYWDASKKDLNFTTLGAEDDGDKTSLLSRWKAYKK